MKGSRSKQNGATPNEAVKLLPPPDYTDSDRDTLTDLVLALRKSHIQAFLKRAELPVTGSKPALRERLLEALKDGGLNYEQLVEFLDRVVPWGKQHVFLYEGPRGDLGIWKNPDKVLALLKQHRLGKLFNARLPLVLPEKLTLSSVTHSDGNLRVTAIQKREYSERTEKYDEERETEEGEKITLKAHVHHVTRTLVNFEWDLSANVATLQITQLHKDGDYEEVAKEFFELVSSWLDIKRFGQLDLRPVIKKLHELEEKRLAEARSHGIHYRSLRGRKVSAHSPSNRDSVLGEPHIDSAMENVRKNGVGHLGNFYWLPKVKTGAVDNPLLNDVHVIVVGDKSRVNFPTPNSEEVVRYVLHRVRALS